MLSQDGKIRGAQSYQKFMNRFSILGARQTAWSNFRSYEPQILGANVQNQTPEFRHPCFKLTPYFFTIILMARLNLLLSNDCLDFKDDSFLRIFEIEFRMYVASFHACYMSYIYIILYDYILLFMRGGQKSSRTVWDVYWLQSLRTGIAASQSKRNMDLRMHCQ
jgi:hypothetical protein